MVELSTFIGQVISDIAGARTNADYYAAGVSEQYHADPFVKALPIPHYIIDEAEIDVPVMIVGIAKTSEQFERQKKELVDAMRVKLPLLLLRGYKFNYARERENAEKQADSKEQSEEKIRAEVNKDSGSRRRRIDISKYDFSDNLLEAFGESAKNITEKMIVNTELYMDNYNYEILKLLDMSEDFSEKLERELRMDMRSYKEEARPYLSDDAFARSSKYIGNLMFFEFKKIMKTNSAVQIDINTVQMNEYATRDCLMHVKLKVKEQDLNLIVEGGAKNKEKRYLSLT